MFNFFIYLMLYIIIILNNTFFEKFDILKITEKDSEVILLRNELIQKQNEIKGSFYYEIMIISTISYIKILLYLCIFINIILYISLKIYI